ncbi:MAG: 4-(cytidine 5'-diphospho)-2-C-methyl-D-erythritol kinase [Dehalococcoidales bacterium]|nr:4-(cytidine 5'-diphospho)-2-C-methyl-D-erythritol kinase [Dehalococcoidales bacterium]
MIKIEAPAKINLTLEVLGKRSDGYHEIRSVVQAIDLCDSLQCAPCDDIRIRSDLSGWDTKESLVSKAVALFQKTTGCTQGVKIEINKRIPLMSGLGGDSSDAAATLCGLNRLWKSGLSREALRELAQQLGSDVPFFLYGGTALMEGRGEKITALPPFPHHWIILVVPDIRELQGKTKRLYDMLKPSHHTAGEITRKLVTGLKSGRGLKDFELFNTFENVTFTHGAELGNYRDHILKTGAPNVHLAGSGPALFTILKDKNQAEELLERLKNQGMQAHLTKTL